MVAHRTLLWVDIGMAVAVALGISIIVFLRDSDYLTVVALAYVAVLVAWALIAERAAIRAEAAAAERSELVGTVPTDRPIPH